MGYSASHYLRHHATAFAATSGTVRTRDKIAELGRDGLSALLFDGSAADPRVDSALSEADALLVSIQPSAGADPALQHFEESIAAAPARRIVYLSTIGVYGDHGGAWVDETTRPVPASKRGVVRLHIENQWLDLGRRTGKQVVVLRLAGIYGPGRSVLDDLEGGTARRIAKPGQVFNRIHVDDIGRAIAGAFARPDLVGVVNITDDEPAPAPDVVAYGAKLMGVEPPPLLPFEDADLSPMARSFYGANRRVSNRRMKGDLGVQLRFPNYRAGLENLMAEKR
jgi:nucleoside-diphosphate-sugar epimerase